MTLATRLQNQVSWVDKVALALSFLRWVCTSGLPSDLAVTDNIALQVLEGIVAQGGIYCRTHILALLILVYLFVCLFVCLFTVPDSVRQQYEDNCQWIREAGKHQLVGLLGNIVSQHESRASKIFGVFIYLSRLWVLRRGSCIQTRREEYLLLLHSIRLFQMGGWRCVLPVRQVASYSYLFSLAFRCLQYRLQKTEAGRGLN